MASKCFTCRVRPAGYPGEPGSAYCEDCDRPRREAARRRAVPGTSCQCAACGRLLATVTDFAGHQETYPRGHFLEGVFTGRCPDPASLGLELAGSVWGTPEGNAKRTGFADRMAAAQARGHAQRLSGGDPGRVATPQAPEAADSLTDAATASWTPP